MPHLSHLHDGSLYIEAGKTIAEGLGPKVPSFPGEPAQTKYPPLLPLLVSAVWLWNPDFSTVRPALAALAWSFVPLMLLAVWTLYRRWQLDLRVSWALTAFVALNGYVALFGSTVMSEVLFTALLAATFIAIDAALDRDGWTRWILAGILGGLTYLTRSTAIVLLAGVPIAVWLMRRDFRGLRFAVAMLPAVAAWTLWVKTYRTPVFDYTTAYYFDYFQVMKWNATISNFHLLVWKNLDTWLTGIGTLILPFTGGDLLTRVIAQAITVGAVAGTFRLCRTYPRAIPFAVSSVLMSVLLVVWCYPPNERLVFPVFPLLLAGLWFEVSKVGQMLRQSWTTQRAAAVVFGLLLLGFVAFTVRQHVNLWSDTLPAYYAEYRQMSNDNAACYARIRTELPSDARFVSHEDPVLWMATGHQGIRLTHRIALWYEDRSNDVLDEYLHIADFARQRGLQYIFQNLAFHGDLTEEQFAAFRHRLETDSALEPVFQCGSAHVWRVRADR